MGRAAERARRTPRDSLYAHRSNDTATYLGCFLITIESRRIPQPYLNGMPWRYDTATYARVKAVEAGTHWKPRKLAALRAWQV